MGLSAVTYALCKKYTDKSLDGIGALKGAPCTVQSVVKTDGRSVVTLEWQSNSGVIQTSKVYVNDGVSIWISGRDYAVNDVVIKNNQLFICNTANTDTTFDPSKWSVVVSGGNDDFNIIDAASDLPASFSSTDRKVYYCIANNTFYLWDGTKWSIINTGVTIRELTKAQYDALSYAEKNNGTIYFVTDEAGGGNDDYYIVSTVADLPTDLGPTDLKIYYCVDTSAFYLWNGTSWNVISAGGVTIRELTKAEYDALSPADKNNGTIYFVTDEEGSGSPNTKLLADMTTTKAVGGIAVGKTYIAGTLLEDILRDMLAPVLYPTLVGPSAELTTAGTQLIETGDTLSTTVTATFNRGSIDPAYGTSGYRSGVATGYSLNGGAVQVGDTFNIIVTPAQSTYQVTVDYAAGEQPKNSAGDNYSSPLPAGSVNSNILTYEFVDALYANTSSANIMTKQALVSKNDGIKAFSLPATTVTNPEQIDVPGSWTVSKIEVFNEIFDKWEDAASQFTKTITSHDDAAGNPVSYNRYTCNYTGNLGARDVRIIWS